MKSLSLFRVVQIPIAKFQYILMQLIQFKHLHQHYLNRSYAMLLDSIKMMVHLDPI
jgi:hypothetical protein